MQIFKNRKSVVVLFIFGFWLIYSISTVSLFVKDLQELYGQDQVRREKQIQYQSDLAMSFMVEDKIDVLKDNLNEAMKLDQFDFAILMDPKEPPFTLVRSGTVDLAEKYEPTEGVQHYGDYLYRTIKINNRTLTLGSLHEKGTFLKSYFQVYAWKILFDIALITTMAGFLIFFVLKDVIQLSRLLKGSTQRDLGSIQPKSLEAQVLLSATESFEKLSKDLAWESQMFSSSLGSAITTELRRGTKPPVSFPAIVVRVDLNSYTQKYLSTDLKQMTTSLNLYFAAAREIIERHQGFIYEYVGDEIVFFFKVGSSQEQTTLRAASCVRDLFKEVSSLHLAEFTLKASLCFGILNFVKLDQGHAFSGIPLIQSARLLNYISNKQVSSLIVMSTDLKSIEQIVDQQTEVSGDLKGFDGSFKLTEINSFKEMTIPNPDNFRSSEDLTTTLKTLKDLLTTKNLEALKPILDQLRSLLVQSHAKQIAKVYTQALASVVDNPFDLRILSSVASLSKNYVPITEYTQEIQNLFLKIESLGDARTKANALMARSHFESELNFDLKTIDKSSNRLFADSLFILGRRSVDPRLLKEIESLVYHKEFLFRSSGLYLTSALLKFHQENDPVYYKANPIFNRMKQILKESLALTDPNLNKHAVAYQEATGEKL